MLMNRRTALGRVIGGGGAAAGLYLSVGWPSALAADNSPLVDTTGGQVRGAVSNGVQSFKGIPYGASTAGANRFMPPQKAARPSTTQTWR